MKKLLVAIIALTLIGTTFAKIAPKKPAPKPLATICKNIGTKKEGLYYMNGKLAKLVKCAPKKVENPKEPVKQNTGNTTINNIPSGYGYSYIT